MKNPRVVAIPQAPARHSEADRPQPATEPVPIESPALLLDIALAWAPAGENPGDDLEKYDQVLGLLLSIPATQLSVDVTPPAETLRGRNRIVICDGMVDDIILNSRQVQSLIDLESDGFIAVQRHPADPQQASVYVTPAGVEAFANHVSSGRAIDVSVTA